MLLICIITLLIYTIKWTIFRSHISLGHRTELFTGFATNDMIYWGLATNGPPFYFIYVSSRACYDLFCAKYVTTLSDFLTISGKQLVKWCFFYVTASYIPLLFLLKLYSSQWNMEQWPCMISFLSKHMLRILIFKL